MSAPGLAEKEVRAEVFVAYSNLSTVRDEQRPQLLHGFLNNKIDASWAVFTSPMPIKGYLGSHVTPPPSAVSPISTPPLMHPATDWSLRSGDVTAEP